MLRCAGGAPPLEVRTLKVKANYDGDLRRFSCTPTFQDVSAHACQKFGLAVEDRVEFQYKDEDGDLITVGSTDELQEAISASCLASPDAPLRLTILVAPTPATGGKAGAAAPEAAAAARDRHLEELLMAAIEALELDPETTLAYVASLKPDEVKTALKKSPLAFVSTFFSSKKAESAFAAACAGADAAAASSSAEFASKAAAFATTASAAAAAVLAAHGNRGARKSRPAGSVLPSRRPLGGGGVDCTNEPTLLPQRFGAAAEALDETQVTITDMDGDTMVFALSEDKSRVQEWLNGALEIDNVREMQMDLETGAVRDSKGRFTVKPEERADKMQALKSLLGRVGVEVVEMHVAPMQTVHIDVDLNASDEEQQKAREEAGDRVRQACGTLGADPEAALQKLAAVFAALPISTTEEGQRAAAALSGGLETAKKGISVARQVVNSTRGQDLEQAPRAPEPFEYDAERDGSGAEAVAGGWGSGCGGDQGKARLDDAPNGQWLEQLRAIREMGLDEDVSEWELVEILEKYLGSLDRVVEDLLKKKLRKTDALV